MHLRRERQHAVRWGTALTILLALAVPATAAAKRRPRTPAPMVAIAAPGADTVLDRPTLRLRVVTADRRTTVRGYVGGKEIALARRGTRWTARLRRRDLQPGMTLFDVVAKDADGGSRHVRRRLYRPGDPGDLGLAVTAAREEQVAVARITLGTGVAKLAATVNGRSIDARLVPRAGEQTVALGAGDGLRTGRNTLRVIAVGAGGVVQRRTVVLELPDGPLAEAGPDATVRTGVEHRLDGRRSRSGANGTRPALRWEILSAPAGSRATLRGRTGARPRFTADVRGTYVLRAAARQAGGTGSADTVTLAAQDSSIPPVGSYLQTQMDLASLGYAGAGGVLIDGQIPSLGGVSALLQTPGMILVLLDRATLEVVAIDVADASQASQLVAGVNAALPSYPKGLVVVLSAPQGIGSTPQSPSTAFEDLLQLVGVDDPTKPAEWDKTVQDGYPWSAVALMGGILQKPLVWRSTHDSAVATPEVPAYPGNLSGYLQLGNGGAGPYTFVHDGHTPFDTSAVSTPSANTVTVGTCPGATCQTFASPALTTCTPSGTGGFHVVVLRAGTLQLVENESFTTNGGCGVQDEIAAVTALGTLLSAYAAPGIDDYVVVVQSIGTPRNTNLVDLFQTIASWEQVVSPITQLGGTTWAFAQMGLFGTEQGYTLVGYNGRTQPGALTPWAREASAVAPTGGAARIAGMAGRDRRNALVPRVTAVGGAIDTSMSTLIYQPKTPWPVPTTPGEEAALAYLTSTVAPTFNPPVIVNAENDGACFDPAKPSFRAAYCDTTLDDSWALVSAALAANASLIPLGDHGFTAQEWSDVLTQLAKETADVSVIPAFISNLQKPFGGVNETAALDLYTPVNDIKTSLDARGSSSSASTWLSYAGDIFGILWAVLPEPANALCGVFSETLAIVSEATANDDGTPALDAAVQTEAESLASEFSSRYVAASQSIAYLREILVTDYGKLRAVVEGPGFSPQTLSVAEDGLRTSARAFATPPLIGSVFAVDQLYEKGGPYEGAATDFECHYFDEDENEYDYYPFYGAPAVVQYTPVSPPWQTQAYVLAGPGNPDDGGPVYPALPPTDLMTGLFATPTQPGDETNLGVYPVHFFERSIGLTSGPAITCFQ